MMYPKNQNYRNKKLLDFAIDAPICFGCGAYNRGQVVAAHADWQEYGKGKGLKAGDNWVAYLGNDCCHAFLHDSGASKEEKRNLWQLAYIASNNWLWSTGKIKAV